jgi:hypothetical protein
MEESSAEGVQFSRVRDEGQIARTNELTIDDLRLTIEIRVRSNRQSSIVNRQS